MKKAFSVLLSVVILMSAVSIGLYASASDNTTIFALASDLHYNIPREAIDGEIDDDIYWYANRRAAMEDESGFIIDEFLNQCAENKDCEFVLISGDIVDNGRTIPQEHYDMAEKFKDFEERSGKQIFVIDGNHDLGAAEGDFNIDDFKRVYADFGYSEALVENESDCSYTADLGEKYRLIALDSCDPTKSTQDGVTAEKLHWVKVQAKQAEKDGRYPILMMHHNLLNHMPLQTIFSNDFIVRNHTMVAEFIANLGIKLVFTGHEHCSDVAAYTSGSGNKIYDFATTSLTMYPLQYRMFTLADSEIKYEAKTIESIDTDALTHTIEGYSDEQIALMNSGMNAYAKGFLKAGIKYRLLRSLSMDKLGVSENDFYYNLVNIAVGGLTDLLEMPLYGENSVQELAKEYNIDIPDSNYMNGWDIVTELASAHYAGEEAFTLDSTEVTIFLRTLDLILLDDLSTVNDEVFLKSANKLLSVFGTDSVCTDLTRLGTKVFGPVTAGEYFILSLVSPILYEFAFDSDGVNDNNGIIEGYSTTSNNISNISERIIYIIKKILLYISLFSEIIFKI